MWVDATVRKEKGPLLGHALLRPHIRHPVWSSLPAALMGTSVRGTQPHLPPEGQTWAASYLLQALPVLSQTQGCKGGSQGLGKAPSQGLQTPESPRRKELVTRAKPASSPISQTGKPGA